MCKLTMGFSARTFGVRKLYDALERASIVCLRDMLIQHCRGRCQWHTWNAPGLVRWTHDAPSRHGLELGYIT